MAPIIKLNSGYDMPQVGFGLWKVDKAVASDVVYNAIKAGYRLFDGAAGKLSPSNRLHSIPSHPAQSIAAWAHDDIALRIARRGAR